MNEEGRGNPEKRMRLENQQVDNLPPDLERVGQIRNLSSVTKICAGIDLTIDYVTWIADVGSEKEWFLELKNSADQSSVPSRAVLVKGTPWGPAQSGEVINLGGYNTRNFFKGTRFSINGKENPIVVFGRDGTIDDVLSRDVERRDILSELKRHLEGATICVPRSRAIRQRNLV
jgi:hypothetical protein